MIPMKHGLTDHNNTIALLLKTLISLRFVGDCNLAAQNNCAKIQKYWCFEISPE